MLTLNGHTLRKYINSIIKSPSLESHRAKEIKGGPYQKQKKNMRKAWKQLWETVKARIHLRTHDSSKEKKTNRRRLYFFTQVQPPTHPHIDIKTTYNCTLINKLGTKQKHITTNKQTVTNKKYSLRHEANTTIQTTMYIILAQFKNINLTLHVVEYI